MRTKTLLAILTLFGLSGLTYAQSTAGLFGCLDPGGKLYNVVLQSSPIPECKKDDALVEIGAGTISSISVGEGLSGGGKVGDVEISVAEGTAIPPICDEGQILVSNGNDGWSCLPLSNVQSREPGSKLWVIPHSRRAEGGLEGFARVLNPSFRENRVICYRFNGDGTFLPTRTTNEVLGAGQTLFCGGFSDAGGWMLISADFPIFVTATEGNARNIDASADKWSHSQYQVEAYPVDCNGGDLEYYEFVCRFAR